ncbi:MAG: ATP-binding cassette domain-containing protein [Planctomycetota bacterium]|jgi:molybdate/tungstate transport system ATP-binding protein
MLELRSITKKLGNYEMPGTSLHIQDGQYMVLVGPSGVGKSVLLEMIAGLISPDSGQILWDSRDITFCPPEKRGFSIVYQDYALFPHLTVRENIQYGLKAKGADSRERLERVETLSELLAIQQLLDRKPGNLSGGEQQRVALARALAVGPKLLLLDEPLSALDVSARMRLRKELKRLNREFNISILHVTHDPEEAIVLGDRVCVMLDSRIRQIGTHNEIFLTPTDPDISKFLGKRNILSVTRIEANTYDACGQPVHIGETTNEISHIWIKPEEILLSLQPFASSARNQFKCRVIGLNPYQSFMEVQVLAGAMKLDVLITHSSFNELGIQVGQNLYATFKSSAIHCY